MEELKKIKKTEAEQTVKVKIEVSGFPNQRTGGKFFDQIVKEEYKRLFEGSNMKVDRDGRIVFEVNICCKTTNGEPEWFAGTDAMHHCLYLGVGCPV